jgi:hypothetical protein
LSPCGIAFLLGGDFFRKLFSRAVNNGLIEGFSP